MIGILRKLVNSSTFQVLPTWEWEGFFAFAYLGFLTGLTTDWSDVRQAAGQVVAAFAVMGTFGHMTIASRLEEAQDRSDQKTVDCYRKLSVYLVAKESLWLLAFLLLHAWTAIGGIPLFLLYPSWRRLYRRLRTSPG